MEVIPIHEGHGDACFARAAGAAHAVQIRFVVFGDGVVDHVGHVIHIDSAGCHVGGNQHIVLAGFESSHGALTSVLAQIPVDGTCGEPAVGEFLLETCRLTLGAGEDNGLAPALGLEDATNDFVFIERVRPIDEVLDVGLSNRLIRRGSPDVNRLVHEAPGQCDDGPWHGRREQHGVTGGGGLREESLDVWQKAEVEHFVCLIEDHDFHISQRQKPLTC